jgi:hypothetical protein
MPKGRKKGSKNKTTKNTIEKIEIKKTRNVNINNRLLKTKEKIGKLQGTFIILDKKPRYELCLRYEYKNKDKFKSLFSNEKLEIIKEIADKLSEELKFPYNPEPQTKIKKSKIKKYNNIETDFSIFKEFNGHLYIYLGFGSIFLDKNNKFHTKRNYEKIDGFKIYELKSKLAYDKCETLLKSYDEITKNKILKEVIRFGDFEDKNSVRITMGLKPIESICNEEGKVEYKEIA